MKDVILAPELKQSDKKTNNVTMFDCFRHQADCEYWNKHRTATFWDDRKLVSLRTLVRISQPKGGKCDVTLIFVLYGYPNGYRIHHVIFSINDTINFDSHSFPLPIHCDVTINIPYCSYPRYGSNIRKWEGYLKRLGTSLDNPNVFFDVIWGSLASVHDYYRPPASGTVHLIRRTDISQEVAASFIKAHD